MNKRSEVIVDTLRGWYNNTLEESHKDVNKFSDSFLLEESMSTNNGRYLLYYSILDYFAPESSWQIQAEANKWMNKKQLHNVESLEKFAEITEYKIFLSKHGVLKND